MSVRLRLALSYMGFLLVAGVGLLALVYYLLRFVPAGDVGTTTGQFVPSREDLQRAVLPRALQVLGALAVFGLAGGWWLAGRMLRPLERIGDVARDVTAGSLGRRVRLAGPQDEFRLLAEAFDAMLDRVEATVDEQRRFAANASHELRTPYAISRSLIDVAVADPAGRDVDELLRRLDETNRRGTEIVQALLTLSQLDHGVALERVPVDVAELAAGVLAELEQPIAAAGVVVTTALGEGDVDADPTLLRQLLLNLVLNGVRHNTGPGGTVEVRTGTAADGSVELRVRNTGPVVAPQRLARLTEPFVRGAGRVAAGEGPRGSGLGLAIVARTADVHGARLQLEAPVGGGLDVRVVFP